MSTYVENSAGSSCAFKHFWGVWLGSWGFLPDVERRRLDPDLCFCADDVEGFLRTWDGYLGFRGRSTPIDAASDGDLNIIGSKFSLSLSL